MARTCSAILTEIWLVLLVTANAASGAEELVTLTMTERVGLARQNEWTTIGVPLPKGKVKSTQELLLIQSGKAIAAEILPVNRWWQDNSLRWVHLIFPTDCPAEGRASVTLTLGEAAPPKQTVRVKDKADRFVVDTGAVTFEVRKKAFNVIDAARIGPELVIAGHDRGLGVRVEGKEYLASLDSEADVRLEEYGPLHAVLHATGSFKDASGEKKFDFDCRIYAYAGSSEAKIVVSLINRQGRESDFIPVSAFFLELPTTVKHANCLFGTEDGTTKTGSLSDESEAYIYQLSASEHVFGGAVQGKGSGKQTKPDTIGWAFLSDGSKGLGAGVKWFWQLHPKSIEFMADGLIRIGLYPARHHKPLKIYTGVARTHELRLHFHAGAADVKRLQGVFAGLQKPLRPFAAPKWYCRGTQSLGDYCEVGGPELYGAFAEKAKKFDDAFELANRRCQAFRDQRRIKGVDTDSYGFLGYGDGVHYVWTPNVDLPENIAWDGNYYGYPHMMCIQFIRTGNPEYFDNFEAHALHVADVHVVHHTDRTHLIGGCRYCPPTDHVRIDPKDPRDYRTAQVYVSDLFNHHKVAGVIDRWYFLRDHRCLAVAKMVLDYCYKWTYGDNDYGQPRGPGMIMDFCHQAYMLTGEERWIQRAANVLRVHKDRELKLSFQAGIFLEGMRRYYEISGDQGALNYVKETVDRLIATNRKGGVTAQAHSFMYLKTGDRKYLDAALENLPQSGQFNNPWKDYALTMRNAAMCIGDLYHAGQTSRKKVKD